MRSYEAHVFSFPSAFGTSQSPESRNIVGSSFSSSSLEIESSMSSGEEFLIWVCLSDREGTVSHSLLVVTVDYERTESRRNVQVASTRLGDILKDDPDLLPKKAFVLKRPSFCVFHDRLSPTTHRPASTFRPVTSLSRYKLGYFDSA